MQLDDVGCSYFDCLYEVLCWLQNMIDGLWCYVQLMFEMLVIEICDLNVVLIDVLGSFQQVINEMGVKFEYLLLLVVIGNWQMLQYVFQNLIDNVIKYWVEEFLEIMVFVKQVDVVWVFGVYDNGVGIDFMYYDWVFEVFCCVNYFKVWLGFGVGFVIVK